MRRKFFDYKLYEWGPVHLRQLPTAVLSRTVVQVALQIWTPPLQREEKVDQPPSSLLQGLPSTYPCIHKEFQTEQSSKSQSQAEIYCEVCSKKFMSPQTYKQHINSQKHKQNRKLLKAGRDKSETSSLSEFEVIQPHQCLFCTASVSEEHLFKKHCFPPFKTECSNLEALMAHVE